MSLFPALTGTASALPLPNTAPTPAAGELVRAEDIQELAQALLNQDKSLETHKVSTPAVVDTWTSVRSAMINEVSKTTSSYNIVITPGDIGSQIIDFPNGVSIDGLRVYIDRVDSGSMPGTNFTVSVKRRARATGVETDVLAFTADPATVVGDYNPYHTIEVLFADATLDNVTYLYFVRVDGEIAPNQQNVEWRGSSVRASLATPSWI